MTAKEIEQTDLFKAIQALERDKRDWIFENYQGKVEEKFKARVIMYNSRDEYLCSGCMGITAIWVGDKVADFVSLAHESKLTP